MTRLPIKGHDGWFKDKSSGSIDCANKSTYDQYMLSVKSEKEKEEEMRTLQKDVSDLKSDMGDIKSLLLTLVQKNHDN